MFTLSDQIKRLSDDELLHQIAEFRDWFKVTSGANTWYTSGEYASDVVSGKTLSLDHTIANAVINFSDELEQYYVDYIEHNTSSRFEAIQASARIKAQAILFAFTSAIASYVNQIVAEEEDRKLRERLASL